MQDLQKNRNLFCDSCVHLSSVFISLSYCEVDEECKSPRAGSLRDRKQQHINRLPSPHYSFLITHSFTFSISSASLSASLTFGTITLSTLLELLSKNGSFNEVRCHLGPHPHCPAHHGSDVLQHHCPIGQRHPHCQHCRLEVRRLRVRLWQLPGLPTGLQQLHQHC